MTPTTPLMHGIHATGVGRGITIAILQAQDAPERGESIEGWVHFCITAAEEAHAEVMNSDDAELSGPGVMERLLEALEADLPEEERLERKRTREAGRSAGTERTRAAEHAAMMAFRLCMPKITGRKAAQVYLACVAAGVQRGYFTAAEARSLLYTAQLALSAYPTRRKRRS